MEDKGDTRTKKVQRNIDNSSEAGPLFSGAHSSLKSDEYFEYSGPDNFSHLLLPDFKCNKLTLENLAIESSPNAHEGSSKLEQGAEQYFWKGFNKFFGKSDELNNLVSRKKTVDLLHSELYSWQTLLRHFVSMPSLSMFNICQVLCHEKGTTKVISYSYGVDKQLHQQKTKIESFNKVFNQIKKSKSNQFSQTQLSIPEFNFVGSFLASIFQLKTHNLLFLLSENSFFPIPEEIISEVDEIQPQIRSVLENVLSKDLSDSKITNLFRVFELLPMPICIKNQIGTTVFQNESYNSHTPTEGDSSINIYKKTLRNEFELEALLSTDLSKSDVQHFQRVSLLGELLNTLQHELSNPLFGIQLATNFLNLQPNDDSVLESLSEISDYCKRCQSILRDFKFIYQDGDKFLDVQIEKLIRETLTLTKSASRGIRKDVTYKTKTEVINTNPTWLSQIIFNLILNSSQAIISSDSKEGSGVIQIVVSDDLKDHISITISDNGPGIEQKEEASIFTPFYTTKEKGTGLGLSICQNLSEKLGGKMTYEKGPLGGASFSLLLPINEIKEP